MSSKWEQIYDPEVFRELGHKLIDRLADHHKASLRGENPRAIPWTPPAEALSFWQELDGAELSPEQLFQHILERSVAIHDPRFMGHQVGMSAPVGVLFGLLSGYLNNGMAVYEMGMAANCMEKLIVDALCARFGLPVETSGGILTSGGTLANLTAMLSARQAMHHRMGGWQGKRPALMVSEEAHYCIERAATTMGWGADAVIKVPVDNAFCMQTEGLEALYQQALREGQQVIAVVGSACSTSTGSYDDLDAIADFCQNHGLWFHVDGAHGAAAIFSTQYSYLLEGIHRADSIVLDFHKLLMTPGLATALVYRDNQDSFRTFQQEAVYLLDLEQDWYNSGKRTFECTKYMISAKVYGIVKAHGWEAFGANVDALYEHARAFSAAIAQRRALELGAPVRSNIICFRYMDEARALRREALNQLNLYIRRKVVEDGTFYIVQTTLRGEVFLRLTIMNPFTTLAHVDALCTKIEAWAAAWEPGM